MLFIVTQYWPIVPIKLLAMKILNNNKDGYNFIKAEVESLVADTPEAGGHGATGVIYRFPIAGSNEGIEVVDLVSAGTRVLRKLVAVGLPQCHIPDRSLSRLLVKVSMAVEWSTENWIPFLSLPLPQCAKSI